MSSKKNKQNLAQTGIELKKALADFKSIEQSPETLQKTVVNKNTARKLVSEIKDLLNDLSK